MTNTTIEITDEQIEALRDEAALHGDEEMRAIAERALAGDASEWAECERVIRDVQSRDDSGRYDD